MPRNRTRSSSSAARGDSPADPVAVPIVNEPEEAIRLDAGVGSEPRASQVGLGRFLTLLPTFEGQEGGVPIVSFLRKLDNIARLAHWNGDTKLAVCQLKFSGTNAEAFVRQWERDSAGARKSWENFKDDAIRRFWVPARTSRYLGTLRTLRREVGETVQQFRSRFDAAIESIREAAEYHGEDPSTYVPGNALLVEFFLDGLNNQSLANQVRRKEPTSLDGAYSLAVKEELLVTQHRAPRSSTSHGIWGGLAAAATVDSSPSLEEDLTGDDLLSAYAGLVAEQKADLKISGVPITPSLLKALLKKSGSGKEGSDAVTLEEARRKYKEGEKVSQQRRLLSQLAGKKVRDQAAIMEALLKSQEVLNDKSKTDRQLRQQERAKKKVRFQDEVEHESSSDPSDSEDETLDSLRKKAQKKRTGSSLPASGTGQKKKKGGSPLSETQTLVAAISASVAEGFRQAGFSGHGSGGSGPPPRRHSNVQCYNCGRHGHMARNCFRRVTRSSSNMTPLGAVTCFKCGEKGHISPRCPQQWTQNATTPSGNRSQREGAGVGASGLDLVQEVVSQSDKDSGGPPRRD